VILVVVEAVIVVVKLLPVLGHFAALQLHLALKCLVVHRRV
jgi:hypothetical protein